ncbi:MAG: AMIN domain-containing protein [Hydrococcus sp. CSU_1_8]|nr:AMIN domain-containing protein [Hydrococcus sp. CSU_1_8]
MQLNKTETGIELILQTPTGVAELLQPNDISSGNNFIADIPNAQLQLPDGKPFAQSNPIEGIREVTVTNVNASTIRVNAIGETARPQIELFDSDSGLIFAFTPVEDSAQTPSTPPESGQIVSINRVQLNPTETGFEIILLTPKGAAQQLRVVNVSEGNNFIAEIQGTQLQLPDGQPYRSENPIEGVSEVTVTNVDENTVRVVAIGEEKQPTVELFDSEDGLIFSAVGDAPSAQGEEDIEIVVTAEKRSELLAETASSITAITQQQIEDGQINRLEDVAANTPNFSVLGTGSRYFSNFTIRGQSNPTIGEGAVGFYVDGVPITDAYSASIDLFDLEQVEVLRGPQGTLYGRNTSGGVVNITTEKPNNQQSLKVSSSFGN